MQLKVFFVFIALWVTSPIINLKAQTVKGVSTAVFNESTAFPFTRFIPIHPGAEIGLTFRNVEKEKSIRQINAYIGGYYHRKLTAGFYLRAEYLHSLVIKEVFAFDFLMGLGYAHTFYPGEIYSQNAETSNFEKVNQKGRPHLILPVGIGISIPNKSKITPFLRQEMMIETPFANGIPVMVHSMLKVGIHIQIIKDEKL